MLFGKRFAALVALLKVAAGNEYTASCGDDFQVAYNDAPVEVRVQMMAEGHILLDCSASDFTISNIRVDDEDGDGRDLNRVADLAFVMNQAHEEWLTFTVSAGSGTTGNLDIDIDCTYTGTFSPTIAVTTTPAPVVACPMATEDGSQEGLNGYTNAASASSTESSIEDCRDVCDFSDSSCVAFTYSADTQVCNRYTSSASPNAYVGGQALCTVGGAPTCTVGCSGQTATLSGDPHSTLYNGYYHHFQGVTSLDTAVDGVPQQYYFQTACDHTDRHYQPYSILAKFQAWSHNNNVAGLDYLMFMLYDEEDTYYVWFSTSMHRWVLAADDVSTLYDTNLDNGLAMNAMGSGYHYFPPGSDETNFKFRIYFNTAENTNAATAIIVSSKTGTSQTIYMAWQSSQSAVEPGRWSMHYATLEVPQGTDGSWNKNGVQDANFKCSTCGMLGDFQHACKSTSVFDCNMADHDISTAGAWYPGAGAAWEAQGWTWQKDHTDSDACNGGVNVRGYISSARAPKGKHGKGKGGNKGFKGAKGGKGGNQAPQQVQPACDPDVETEVIAKCQEAREEMETCCRNIGGVYCDEMQESCVEDVCIAATDNYAEMDNDIETMFTTEVEHECENTGQFGPVPALMYEFANDLTESMSGGDSTYDLQAVGDAQVLDGALVCDGSGDYVYSKYNLDFGFEGHSLEVLVSVDNLESQGGGTIALDGLYTTGGDYTHTKFDSIVFNEVDNNKKWISGSEFFSRTDTSGSNTAETAAGEMVHLITTYDPDDNVVELYRNGVLEQSFVPEGGFLTASADQGFRMMFCQRHLNAGLNDFEGKIYMGAVYDYALTQEDVENIFHSRVVEIEYNGEMLTIESVGDTMHPGSELLMGQGMVSADHRWLATFRPDGWFMVYDMNNEEVVFESENGRAGVTCMYNDDGSLGVYGAGGRAVWHSRTTHDSPLMLVMGINGLLQGYADDNSVYYEVGTDESVDTETGNVAVLGAQELKDVSSKWTLTLHGSTETFLLYFCALLVLVNVVCGSVYCYSKRTQMPYKVVSMDGTEAEITESELEDNEKFLE